MPRSMTGFGRGEAAKNHRKFRVELKSVNSRHLELVFKMPRFLFPFEDLMRKRIAVDVYRGKVEVWVHFESNAPQDFTVNINEPYADALALVLGKLAEKFELGAREGSLSLDTLVKLPDVLVFGKPGENFQDRNNEIWGLLENALEAAVFDFDKMRHTEGTALALELAKYKSFAFSVLDGIRGGVAGYQEASIERLKLRLAELTGRLGVNLDSERMHQEIAFLADKSDVSEELARLSSHFAQFGALIDESGALGRKIDFLVQEMNREANTIGSKSQSVELTGFVVELKSVIEKIREQAQNIE